MHYIMTPSKEVNDIVFVGNSRTFIHIDPRVVDSVTGKKAYNLGLDGCTIPFFNMALCKYLQCHPIPKYVVINADFSGLNTGMQVYNYPDYQQYIGDSVVSACLVPYYSEFKHSLLGRLSLFRQINSKPDDEKMGNFIYLYKNMLHRHNDVNLSDPKRGFSPSDRTWESQSHTVKTYKAIYTPQAFDLMRQMIANCQSKGIKVIMVCTPMYKDYHHIIVNYNEAKDTLQSIANSYKVPYWIYSDTYLSDKTANFYNVEHLNAEGAAAFSRMLAEDIKQYIADSTYLPDMEARKKNQP